MATDIWVNCSNVQVQQGDWASTSGKRLSRDGIDRNYLFELNDQYLIDGAHYGNLSRFINNAPSPAANCLPTVPHVLGDHRIAFVALRKIKRHDELMIDYGEHFYPLNKPKSGRKRLR
ncbi:MAG: SET [Tremellales sp. Tagirdzhanova-0007]|nr:MAG: SET [Tremellales sp. Tagirdzhanova-0007]